MHVVEFHCSHVTAHTLRLNPRDLQKPTQSNCMCSRVCHNHTLQTEVGGLGESGSCEWGKEGVGKERVGERRKSAEAEASKEQPPKRTSRPSKAAIPACDLPTLSGHVPASGCDLPTLRWGGHRSRPRGRSASGACATSKERT
eukprot:3111994-Rhodomonas_salina.3